jgi:acyl-CoA synthetase (AMP-forming)/AMP-acid ligase II/pimeloyl-ACP methyl ester carboxylesterase
VTRPDTRFPRAAATLPPVGLPGLDARFSRIVAVPESGAASSVSHDWHILDNAEVLAEAGVTPIGTILCVHGNPTWSYLWRRLVETATEAASTGAAPWRVIAVDQLDMGFSERTGVARPLARRVRDLGDLTAALALDGPVVSFGHDWGGVVSLGWAVDHPELLAGVMLLNTAVHQPTGYPIPAPLRLTLRRSVLRLATVTTPGFLETTLALAHPALEKSVKDAYRAPYRGASRRAGIGGFVADIPVEPSHESFAELTRISGGVAQLSVPALMLWGPRDPIFSDRYLDDLADRLPHADIHRFEGSGHLVAEDVDYAANALAWLGEQDALASAGVELAETAEAVAEEAPRRPLWHYLDEFQFSADTAIVDMAPGREKSPQIVSWQALSRRVGQIALGLQSVGVKQGDRVSLLVPPGADLTAVLYACVRIGAVVVVADAGLGLRGLTRAVRGAWPDHVIGAAPGLAAARALGWPGQKISTVTFPAPVARALGVKHTLAGLIQRAEGLWATNEPSALPEWPAANDIAAVLFTSGSTGPAKGVVYRHSQLEAVRDALAAQYGVGPGTGLVAGFAPFALLGPALGCRSVTPDMDVTSPKTLTADAVAAAVAAVDATVVFLSPAALTNVVVTSQSLDANAHRALAGVQTFLSAGAPVPEALLAAAGRLMPNAGAHTPYGMTEGLLLTDIDLAGIRELRVARQAREAEGLPTGAGGVCVGRPNGTTRLRISALDDAGNAVGEPSEKPDVTGEIIVSAPHIKSHYDRLWSTDRQAVRGTPSETPAGAERWHRTGDVGHLDAEGRLWVEGRMPHLITTAAGVITPVGVEQRIETLAAVARAAVVGVGPAGTQQLVVVLETVPAARRVSLANPALAGAVRSMSGQPISAILVVPRLPTDIRHNSKIDRSALARWSGQILAGQTRMRRP